MQTIAEILPKGFGGQAIDEFMPITMRRDFMAGSRDARDKLGVAMSNPAQDKESAANLIIGKEFQKSLRVRFDTARKRFP